MKRVLILILLVGMLASVGIIVVGVLSLAILTISEGVAGLVLTGAATYGLGKGLPDPTKH